MPSSRIQGLIDRAVERFEYLFDVYPEVVVSDKSGGKDSTAVMEIGAIAARSVAAVGSRCHFYDEEVIPSHTEDYIRRIASRGEGEGIDFTWYCVPLRDLERMGGGRGESVLVPVGSRIPRRLGSPDAVRAVRGRNGASPPAGQSAGETGRLYRTQLEVSSLRRSVSVASVSCSAFVMAESLARRK